MAEETQFSADRQPKKKRGKSTRTLILEGIQEAVKDEYGEISKEKATSLFFVKVAQRAFNAADKDSPMFIKLMMDKGWSATKAVHDKYTFDFPKGASPSDQAQAITAAIANGDIPMDIGQGMLTMIKDAIQIKETTELEQRIRELEEANGLG